MKYLKMLSLAAVAAMALMAFGAGTASATELCKAPETPCSAANMYPAGTTIFAHLTEGKEAVLTAGFATVRCTESTVKGKTTNTGSSTETVDGPIEELTFGNCNCTVTVLTKGELEVHTDTAAEATDDGILTGKNSRVTINCSGVSCIFGTAATGTEIGTIHSSTSPTTHAELTANAKLPYFTGDASNFTCTLGSGTGSWKAEYTITEPKPLYIS